MQILSHDPQYARGTAQPDGYCNVIIARPRDAQDRRFRAAPRYGLRDADGGRRGAVEAGEGRSGGRERTRGWRVRSVVRRTARPLAAAGYLSGATSGHGHDGNISGAGRPDTGRQRLSRDVHVTHFLFGGFILRYAALLLLRMRS